MVSRFYGGVTVNCPAWTIADKNIVELAQGDLSGSDHCRGNSPYLWLIRAQSGPVLLRPGRRLHGGPVAMLALTGSPLVRGY